MARAQKNHLRATQLRLLAGVGFASLTEALHLRPEIVVIALAALGLGAGWSFWRLRCSWRLGVAAALIPAAGWAMKLAYC